jgi:serine/threonine-protein phosphatase 2A activator
MPGQSSNSRYPVTYMHLQTTLQREMVGTTTTSKMTENTPRGILDSLSPGKAHRFEIPSKKIHDGADVAFWLTTYAYTDIMTFVLQLNVAMFPRKISDSNKLLTWELDGQNLVYSPTVQNLRVLLSKLEKMIEEAPPDPGPRRFGNFSFRKWHDIVEKKLDGLLDEHLPKEVIEYALAGKGDVTARDELKSYLLGSFGSAQRLDYGTGHELSFLAFLGSIWKLGGFPRADDGVEERAIVLGVIEP